MLATQNNTLGRLYANCRWVNMGEPLGWRWVCFSQNKVTTPEGAQLLGSEADLIATYMRDLADSKNQVAYYLAELQRWPDSTEARNRLAYWQARVASLEYLLSRGAAYIRKEGSRSYNQGGDLIAKTMLRFQKSVNKLMNSDESGFDPGTLIDDTLEVLNQNIAGIPIWGALLLAGGGAYLLFSKKKKK